MFKFCCRNFFTAQVARISSSNVHCNIFYEGFESIGFGNEVGFAVNFNQNADASAAVNVGFYQTFGSNAACFLAAAARPFSRKSQLLYPYRLRLRQGLFAVHHAGTGAFA